MSYLRYGWTVIRNIITLCFLVLLFNYTKYEPFQTIVVSILVLIYIQLISFWMGWSYHQAQIAFALQDEFYKLQGLIKKKTEEEQKTYKEEMEEHKKKLQPKMIQAGINSGFAFLFYIITLYHLVFAVL